MYGSIIARDLGKAGPAGSVAAAPAPQPGGVGSNDIPVSNIRGVIAKRLVQSKQVLVIFIFLFFFLLLCF